MTKVEGGGEAKMHQNSMTSFMEKLYTDFSSFSLLLYIIICNTFNKFYPLLSANFKANFTPMLSEIFSLISLTWRPKMTQVLHSPTCTCRLVSYRGYGSFHASYSWSSPQLPKCCGCIDFCPLCTKRSQIPI